MGTVEATPDPWPQSESPARAEGSLQGGGAPGGSADDQPPASHGLPASPGCRYEAQSCAADHRSSPCGCDPGDVEEGGGVRPQQAPLPHHQRAGVTPPISGAKIAGTQYEADDRFGGEHPLSTWPRRRAAQAPTVGYAPPKYQLKQWPYEAQLEVWYSFAEVHPCFALAVLTYWWSRSDRNDAPHCLEQAVSRNRLQRSAAAVNTNHPPDAEGEKVGYTEECALDVAFLGSARRSR
jgi:hypothetical protein